MSLPRFYQPVKLAPESLIKLDDQASHHLARVLRAKSGDSLVLFNGEGGEYQAIITQIDKKGVEVRVTKFIPHEVESSLKLHLAQGITRGEKMDFIVQKAVELGVTHLTPLLTARSNVRLDEERTEKRYQHWQAVIASACEQCGRNRLPLLDRPEDFREWVMGTKADYKFVLSPHVDKKLPVSIPPESSVLLLIGPEGGLSEEEVKLSETSGFIPLNLGKRVLRTETASIAALAALQARYGDFCH